MISIGKCIYTSIHVGGQEYVVGSVSRTVLFGFKWAARAPIEDGEMGVIVNVNTASASEVTMLVGTTDENPILNGKQLGGVVLLERRSSSEKVKILEKLKQLQ